MEEFNIDDYWIDAADVDSAREKIFEYIQKHVDERVIYFHGWSGLGASAVLRSVAELLPSRRTIPQLCFDRIIFIDCSEWKSRRSMQRAIAEELKLDRSTMAILDKQDEEDDYHGVSESSRDEIVHMSRKINHLLKNSRFMMIFCNGSDNEIDLYGSGVPPFDKMTDNILLWTYGRRLRTITEHEQDKLVQKLKFTHILLFERIQYFTSEEFYTLLCKEGAIIAAGINPTKFAECCLYKLFLHGSLHTTTKYDWAGHASNCWICDGILHEDISREISNVLNREIRVECDVYLLEYMVQNFKKHLKLPFVRVKDGDVYEEGPYRWISITSKDTKLHGYLPVHRFAPFVVFASTSRESRPLYGGIYTIGGCGEGYFFPTWMAA